jgi:hypothetical protein
MRGHLYVRLLVAVSLLSGMSGFAYAQPTGAKPEPKTNKKQDPAPQTKADDALAALKKLLAEHPELIDQLKALLNQNQKPGTPPANPGDVPDIPPLEIPGDKPPVNPTTPPPVQGGNGPVMGTTRASLTPDISVIGNHIGRFISVRGDADRNRFQLGEVELGLQQPILTGVRFDAFLNAGSDDGFKAGFEEAYVTMSQLGHLPVGALLGKKRLNFGKVNPVHPHSRLYVDQPAALANLVDPDSLNGNGASVNYLFPFKNIFANLEVGLWNLNPTGAGITVGPPVNPTFYSAGAGITGNFPMARLWVSKELQKGAEFEFGASQGFGRADIGDNISLTGLDMTYRSYPGTFKRLLLQGEVFWHRRDDKMFGSGEHTRSGHYLLASYRPDQFLEYGIRYDNSKFPWPLPGREQSFSLIWTDKLTEVTLLRLQYKHGDRISDVFLPSARGFNEIYLQFIWGAGSHTHPLQ